MLRLPLLSRYPIVLVSLLPPTFIRVKPGHIVILGRTGSGKSNTAKLLCAKLSRSVPVLILDWAGEYFLKKFRRMIPGKDFKINPFQLTSESLSEHIDFLIDLFGDTYSFTEPQRYIFRLALKQAYEIYDVPTLAQVLELLDEMPIQSKFDYEIKTAIKRRLASLAESLAGKALSETRIDLDTVFKQNIIVDLSYLRSMHARKLFVLLFLKILYDYISSQEITKDLKHVTVIEEAQNVIPYRRLDSPMTIGERLFAEMRKYGECIIAVAQFPSEVAWSIIKNSRIIFFHQMLQKDISVLELSGVLSDIEKLRVGVAYLYCDGACRKIKILDSKKYEDYNKRTNRIWKATVQEEKIEQFRKSNSADNNHYCNASIRYETSCQKFIAEKTKVKSNENINQKGHEKYKDYNNTEVASATAGTKDRKFVAISRVIYSRDPYVQRLIERLETEVTILKQIIGELKDESEADREFLEELSKRVDVLERRIDEIRDLKKDVRALRYQLARVVDYIEHMREVFEVEVMRHA